MVKEPVFSPKSYQDLKVTVACVTAVLCAVACTLFFKFILPENQQAFVSGISGNPLLNFSALLAVCGGIAYLLVFTFEFHQTVYDALVIGWRRGYELDFILPRLVQPFGDRIDPRFFTEASRNREDFLKVFWFFAGDYEKDKIRENYKVRFCEVASKYWITQYAEGLLLILEAALISYYFVYRSRALPLDPIVIGNTAVAACFILNRFFAGRVRQRLRANTLEQIEDIHKRFGDKLDEELESLHKRYNLVYAEKPRVIGFRGEQQ